MLRIHSQFRRSLPYGDGPSDLSPTMEVEEYGNLDGGEVFYIFGEDMSGNTSRVVDDAFGSYESAVGFIESHIEDWRNEGYERVFLRDGMGNESGSWHLD